MTIVAPEIRPEIVVLSEQFPKLRLVYKPYDNGDLEGIDLVVAATCIGELNQQVRTDAKAKKILINVADTLKAAIFI